ncbi:A disintegrin and metalloproteinase with thrombospondin motifs 6 [Araneus ventricosus]|uniref:A disintegrin and metalloproteinase with thrombospondin motifs 6 n=1 Tax=Araneus ventricosus TaxID=182803 RepID=A0A4Y2HZR4_ARAVE|nr:A disintegrin and metalloproteinase with thrombospondin motifs 6 [Araneus ventricosus]
MKQALIDPVILAKSLARLAPLIHSRLDPATLKRIFHIDSYEQVPEYEIVQLQTLSKRSVDDNEVEDVHLSAFGKDIHLHLKRNKIFENQLKYAKTYAAEMTDTGIQYTEVTDEVNDLGRAYQDIDKMTAVTIRHGENGQIQMDGTIGDNLVVKPVPTDSLVPQNDIWFRRNFDADHTNSTIFLEGLATRENPHLLFHCTRGNSSKISIPLSAFFTNTNRTTTDGHRSKRSPIPHAFPEVLLLVDYDSYAVHEFSETKTRNYLASFLNGVDLRFKTLSNPRVTLLLNGIIIAKTRDVTPYLENNRKLLRSFDAHSALNDMAKHMFSVRRRLPAHDLALLLTKLDICSLDKTNGRCSPTTEGIAYVGGACQVDERNRRTEKVGIVEDNGGFSGILSAAHEIAHLLGAKHDGSSPSPFLGGPGAAGCSSQGGYIMSLKKFGSRRFQWSRCTIEQFRHFLSTPRASCLFNHPGGNRLGDSKWPGQLLSLDEQCKRDGGTGACQRDSRVCSQLHCYSATGHCYASRPAAEGSPCGQDRICRNGDCVASASSTLAGNSFNSRTACRDDSSKLMGGLTCRQYLQKYSFACKSSFATENCCHSYRRLC